MMSKMESSAVASEFPGTFVIMRAFTESKSILQ